MKATAVWPETLEKLSLLSRAHSFEVWDCWDRGRFSRVVVKLPRDDRLDEPRTTKQLLDEGALLQRLSHPNILRAYETIETPVPMVIMETLSGETLSAMLDEADHLETEEIAHLGLQLCSALAYLHSQGVAHLDLKPSNIIGQAGRARLIDLGLARPFGDGRPGVGTWSYMAPEQTTGVGLGPATDVWGLGATLFECVTGHPPFDDPDIEGLQSFTGTGSSGAWPGRFPQLDRRAVFSGEAAERSPDLQPLILACLDPDPGSRLTLRGLAAGLEDVLEVPDSARHHSGSIPS